MNMPEHFEVANGRGFFQPVGTASLDDAVSMVSAAIAYARDQGVDELLVDARGVMGFNPPDVFQRYDLIKRWLAVAAGQVRTAFVLRPEMIDHSKFGVMVAENRGYATDVFTTEEAALHWLDEKRSA